MPGGLTPEQLARVEIDRKLEAAGWVVQDFEQIDLSAGRGIAVREFRTATGPADYLLYGDRKALRRAGRLRRLERVRRWRPGDTGPTP